MSSLRQKKKEQTRIKILHAASRLLKDKGIKDTSVQDVMAKAGLTHGSFYAYFKDKNDMVVQAFQWGVDQALEQAKLQLPKGLSPQSRMQAFLEFYLSPEHRARAADGCPMAALADDFSGLLPTLRKEFAGAVDVMVEDRRKFLSDEAEPLERDQWLGIMSCYVGALILGRACQGTPIADEIAEGSLKFILGQRKKGKALR